MSLIVHDKCKCCGTPIGDVALWTETEGPYCHYCFDKLYREDDMVEATACKGICPFCLSKLNIEITVDR